MYEHIWNFLNEHPFEKLTVQNLKDFSQSDLFDNLNDQDLFRLLFKELEDIVDDIEIDETLEKKDQLFDLFLTVSDLYQDRRLTLQKIEKASLKAPSHLKDAYTYSSPIIDSVIKKIGIESIGLKADGLPLISALSLPTFMNTISLYGLSCYYLYLFLHEEDFEKVLSSFQEKLTFITFA